MGALVVYSITDRDSFKGVPAWLGQVKEYADPHCSIILVANKIDMVHNNKADQNEVSDIEKDTNDKVRQVTHMEGRIMASRFKVKYWEVSGLTQENVEMAFRDLACEICKKYEIIEKNREEISRKLAMDEADQTPQNSEHIDFCTKGEINIHENRLS